MRHVPAAVLLSLAVLGPLACTGSDDPARADASQDSATSPSEGSTPPHNHGHGDAPCKGDEDPQQIGFKQATKGKKYSLELVSVMPAQHERGGENEAVVKLLDEADQPVEGADLKLQLWTTAHGGHENDFPPEVAPAPKAGHYAISMMSYVHGGPWELRFQVKKGNVTDSLTLVWCVKPAADGGMPHMHPGHGHHEPGHGADGGPVDGGHKHDGHMHGGHMHSERPQDAGTDS